MLREWEKRFPGRIESIFRALASVAPSHLLDRTLHDFAESARRRRPIRTATGRSIPTPPIEGRLRQD